MMVSIPLPHMLLQSVYLMATKYLYTCIMMESHVTLARIHYLSNTGLQLLLGRCAMGRAVVYLYEDICIWSCCLYSVQYTCARQYLYVLPNVYSQLVCHVCTSRQEVPPRTALWYGIHALLASMRSGVLLHMLRLLVYLVQVQVQLLQVVYQRQQVTCTTCVPTTCCGTTSRWCIVDLYHVVCILQYVGLHVVVYHYPVGQ